MIIPLLILKRSPVGGVNAMLLDALEFRVAFSWIERMTRPTALGLFVYRMVR